MFLTKWPTTGCWKLCFLIVEIASSESPSKIMPLKPSSQTNRTARLAAIVSRATMDEGRGIISDSAAKTSPEELRTTTPILAAPKSSKTATSKFVFNRVASGGFQMTFFGSFFDSGFAQNYWKSARCFCANSGIFSRDATASLTLILLRRFPITQQIMMKPSAPRGFCSANLKRSTKNKF